MNMMPWYKRAIVSHVHVSDMPILEESSVLVQNKPYTIICIFG